MNKRLTILGSTGSVGRQCLDVLPELPGIEVAGLAAGSNWQELARQAARFRPPVVALRDDAQADQLAATLGNSPALITGPDAMCELIDRSRPDIVLTAVVGSAGLEPTMHAIAAGATLALANKETLVCAGSVVMPAARQAGVAVLPVDSEHSGIFQCLAGSDPANVRRVIITSSGGALRDRDPADARTATVEEALDHPTWSMGPKITIDSATLMNKALEIIEAHWLFGLDAEQIEVVIHPQSIIHAMVEFSDGSMLAQLAPPDMKGPIAYALTYPERPTSKIESLDLAAISRLDFRPVEGVFHRAVELAYEVIALGGASGAVLNGANEQAVEAFLGGHIRFGQIVELVGGALDDWKNRNRPEPSADKGVSLKTLQEADRQGRNFVSAHLPATT